MNDRYYQTDIVLAFNCFDNVYTFICPVAAIANKPFFVDHFTITSESIAVC